MDKYSQLFAVIYEDRLHFTEGARLSLLNDFEAKMELVRISNKFPKSLAIYALDNDSILNYEILLLNNKVKFSME